MADLRTLVLLLMLRLQLFEVLFQLGDVITSPTALEFDEIQLACAFPNAAFLPHSQVLVLLPRFRVLEGQRSLFQCHVEGVVCVYLYSGLLSQRPVEEEAEEESDLLSFQQVGFSLEFLPAHFLHLDLFALQGNAELSVGRRHQQSGLRAALHKVVDDSIGDEKGEFVEWRSGRLAEERGEGDNEVCAFLGVPAVEVGLGEGRQAALVVVGVDALAEPVGMDFQGRNYSHLFHHLIPQSLDLLLDVAAAPLRLLAGCLPLWQWRHHVAA
jgi:hypothetical protein